MSSNIQNVISTVFTARAGSAIATMRQYGGGLSNIGSNMQQVGRNSSYMNSQLRAVGTTLRYAFAGTVVFGLAKMGSELKNIQGQLALMGAVGEVVDSTRQSIELTDQKLTTMLDNIQREAPNALTDVNDLSAGVVNFLSSVQGVREDQVVGIVSRFAQVAQIAQVQTDDMTKAVTGMNNAFGRNHGIKEYEQLMRGIFLLIREAPGGVAAGHEIIQQFAPLSAVGRLARTSPGEMLGSYLTVLRGGGTPSTAGRGLQFLLQSLAQPTKEGKEAQAMAGITPALVQQRGGMWALRRMMEYAQGLGISGDITKLEGLNDEQLDIVEQGGGAKGLGISGPGMEFLSDAIGRIHGIRALALLMSQGGTFAADQQQMAAAMGTAKGEKEFAEAIEKFLDRQPLKRMTTALISMRTQIEQDIAPLLNFAAGGVSWAAQQTLAHQDETKYGLAAAGVGAAAWSVGRMIKGKGLPRVAGAPGMLLGAAAIGAEGLGASPMNPMFVVVVGQMFGGGKGGPGGIFGPAGRNAPDAPGNRGGGRFGRMLRRLGPIGRLGGRIPAGGLAAGALTAGVGMAAWELAFPEDAGAGSDYGGNPALAAQRQRQQGNLWRARRRQIAGPGANIMQLYGAQKKENFGQGYVAVDVLVRQPDGKKERKVYNVPVEFWQNGPVPGNRGRPGARR